MLAVQQEAEDEAPVFQRLRPHLIEEDTESDEEDTPTPIVRPAPVRVARPVALKVVCPIPKEAIEEFYEEAYRQGIAGTEVHAATAIAQDWHRKWTQQDEQGHTMPESSQDGLIPEHYAYNLLEREIGAKNPSPDDLHSEYERKRSRQDYFRSYSSISDSSSADEESSSSPIPMPEPKRPAHEDVPLGPSRPPMTEDNQVPPQSQALVRPVAVRVVRPPVVIPPEDFNGAIPEQVVQSFRQAYSYGQLSPLTLPSEVGTRKSGARSISPMELNDYFDSVPSEISHPNSHHTFYLPRSVNRARSDLLQALAAAGGEVGQGAFDTSLDVLSKYFVGLDIDTRSAVAERPIDGLWLTLTKPSFFGNLGDNDNGDPMYTLGRMTFDMFSPTNLVCSLQGNFNIVKQVPQASRSHLRAAIPPALKEDVEEGDSTLRTYE